MLHEISITDEDILYAEKILLPEGKSFDSERREFIKNLETIDLQAIPGSGKTTALLAKLVILETKLPLSNGGGILVLSHTNAAIDEIKYKIEKFCPKLFTYPNFIGTIQSFVDSFLAIPYYTTKFKKKPLRIDNEVYEEEIEKRLTQLRRYSFELNPDSFKKIYSIEKSNPSVFYNIRFAINENEIILLKNLNGKKLNVEKPRGRTKPENYQDYLENEKEILYKWFYDFKCSIMEKGILHFDDAYFLAERYLYEIPKIKNIIQKRFPYVFVDEMQDMDNHQYNLLEKLFYNNGESYSKFQRIGDRNQAIYNNVKSEYVWKDRDAVLSLQNSHRLSSRIASVVKNFALNHNTDFKINGKNSCNIKPHIILFEDTTIKKVIPKFSELVKYFRVKGELIDFEKYPIKAICWSTEWKSEADRQNIKKIRLEDYFSNYKKERNKTKIDYNTLKSYLIYYDKESKTLKPIKNNIINAFLKVLRLENILSIDEKYFTKASLLKYLKDENIEFYEEFNLKLYNWSMNIIKENIETVYSEFKEFIYHFLKIFNRSSYQSSVNFIEDDEVQISIDGFEVDRNNIYVEDDISVEVVSIHSVKGQTHCATLYLESFYKIGYGHYESERLRNQFLGTQTICETLLSISSGRERVKESAQMAYVGFSRPTNLLCIAIHKDRFNKHLSEIDRNIWEIIEI
ncbi:UvrD-helicase domain-containing protein [Riemerella anatipestifer]|uniref:UvrD-helicase domain-containing protein n=1 Tax=Riemerella anatipestifer TaxID=34085 RepID=UPI0030BF0C9E